MNSKATQTLYRPGDFACRTGVTVRTLHHYDRVGLLRASTRSASGHRLYSAADLARLQQIVTLKFIGFSLRDIKRLLTGTNLASALRLQTKALEQKRHHLDQAIAAITQAERLLGDQRTPDWEAFARTIEVIQIQTNNEWIKKYYNEEAQRLLAKRSEHWSPQLQKQLEKDWVDLLNDIEASARKNVDPVGTDGQALAERHTRLIERFTGGHAAIGQGLAELWKDRANWPTELREKVYKPFAQQGIATASGNDPHLLTEAGREFLGKALKAQLAKANSKNGRASQQEPRRRARARDARLD